MKIFDQAEGLKPKKFHLQRHKVFNWLSCLPSRWIIWKKKKNLNEDLIFTLNFKKSQHCEKSFNFLFGVRKMNFQLTATLNIFNITLTGKVNGFFKHLRWSVSKYFWKFSKKREPQWSSEALVKKYSAKVFT